MKIAVTGGTGGVGRAITEYALGQGHSVVSLDREVAADVVDGENLTFIEADAADYDALVAGFAGCDAMIHMAAIPNPRGYLDHVVHNNNVVGSYNAMRAAIENGIMRICQASSVNAIGLSFSRNPKFDYFPVDEKHANYDEDPYSLSKWICEAQADSLVRRYEDISIASMRFHWVVPDVAAAAKNFNVENGRETTHLWSYTRFDSAARACVASLSAPFKGHEAFYILAKNTCNRRPSLELAAKYCPNVPVVGDLSGNRAFFNTNKAEQMLGWTHDL